MEPDQACYRTLQEKHSVRFDSTRELQEVLLAEDAASWRTATKRHEDEGAQFGGIVANPESRKGRGRFYCLLRNCAPLQAAGSMIGKQRYREQI